MVFKPSPEEFAAFIKQKNPIVAGINRKKLAERLEASAEVVLYDHDLKSEYLTDYERELIVEALKR